MKDIRIHTRSGKTYKASECDTFLDHWQKFEATDFLKNYLLRNLPLCCREDGLDDERFKLIKDANGRTIWQEGDLEAMYDGLRYEVVEEGEALNLEPFNPIADVSATVKRHIEMLQAQAYYEGYKAAANSIMNYERRSPYEFN